ncbi:hypothetical protein [Mammaliicoccus sciuri]|uniref:hypothetical protein n=1 Tax=Mammaliicoccus sciuri TaxID=1296 RepID=UPI0021D14437|nr:hypothetical protein [Mammaliicoccus sciuri]UXU70137.1 hypothetical protein MUA36_05510 [Mammaliicoccus sciuri]WQL34259.1 hypothetical protein P3U41_05680 [Mammaliicoccus sciuri]WQL61198.1 hypothetical protein P3T96_05680 [Mammaliicoccus sciuri]
MYSKPIDSLIKLVDKSEIPSNEKFTFLESDFVTDVLEEELTRYFKVSSVEIERIRVMRYGQMYVDYKYYNTDIQNYTLGTLTLE